MVFAFHPSIYFRIYLQCFSGDSLETISPGENGESGELEGRGLLFPGSRILWCSISQDIGPEDLLP